eukprot:5325220-Alexandrium_andersonii.AAC.1
MDRHRHLAGTAPLALALDPLLARFEGRFEGLQERGDALRLQELLLRVRGRSDHEGLVEANAGLGHVLLLSANAKWVSANGWQLYL